MVKYKKGYNLQLAEEYIIQIKITGHAFDLDFIKLDSEGFLTIKKGYAWDGASKPAVNTRNFIESSLVHDALYQGMREGVIPLKYRDYADKLLQEICLSKGMFPFRAWYVYHAVRLFAKPAAIPRNKKKIYIIP